MRKINASISGTLNMYHHGFNDKIGLYISTIVLCGWGTFL